MRSLSQSLRDSGHLFLDCVFSKRICSFFLQMFETHSFPYSTSEIWTAWITFLDFQNRPLWDLIARAIMWNLWLERNNPIFQFLTLPSYSIMIKITNMLLFWFLATTNNHEVSQKNNCSLNFISTRSPNQTGYSDQHLALE